MRVQGTTVGNVYDSEIAKLKEKGIATDRFGRLVTNGKLNLSPATLKSLKTVKVNTEV